MDDLTNEEHEALLLMSEHGIAAPLSPAAQAVLDAAHDGANEVLFDIGDDSPVPMCAAAALRTAALYCKRDAAILLAIADELEDL
jgi:hypothetical protein